MRIFRPVKMRCECEFLASHSQNAKKCEYRIANLHPWARLNLSNLLFFLSFSKRIFQEPSLWRRLISSLIMNNFLLIKGGKILYSARINVDWSIHPFSWQRGGRPPAVTRFRLQIDFQRSNLFSSILSLSCPLRCHFWWLFRISKEERNYFLEIV